MPPLTFAEFFAGVGLFRIGLERAGWRAVWGNDICPKKARMYAGFFGGALTAALHVGDVRAVCAADVPPATLWTCSFPCTDLSLAGKQKGISGGGQSSVIFEFDRILSQTPPAKRPLVVLLENVPGLLNKPDDFARICDLFHKKGYNTDTFLLDALHFVPQSRRRLFIVAAAAPFFDRHVRIAQTLAARHADFLHPRLAFALQAQPAPPISSAAARAAAARFQSPCLHLNTAHRANNMPPPPAKKAGGLNALLEKLPATDPRWWGRERVAHHLALMPPHHRARLLPQEGRVVSPHGRVGRSESFRNVKQNDMAGALTAQAGRNCNIAYGEARAFCNRGRRGKGGGSVPEVRPDDYAGTLRAGCGGNSQNFIAQAFPAYQRTKKTAQQTDIYPRDYHPAMTRDKSKRFVAFQVGQRRGKMTETRNSDTAAALGNSQARLSNVAHASPQGVRMRALTAREAGRLMGLPDEFPIVGVTERQATGFFGDGVVVPVVEWIARHIINPRLHRLKNPPA